MNNELEGGGRKQPWHNLRFYPSICLKGLRKRMINLRIMVSRLRYEAETSQK
jgi:hypothetical protein